MRTTQLLCLPALLIGCSSEEPTDTSPAASSWFEIAPRPASASVTDGTFAIAPGTTIAVSDDGLVPTAELFAAVLRPSTGFALPVSRADQGSIVLRLDPSLDDLGDEGYELTVTPESVVIAAPRSAGVFYGTQTLRQMLSSRVEQGSLQPGPWVISTGVVRDRPRFAWRGLMIDVARHFFTVDDLRRHVDAMSYYKMNRLHLHLTDDQGWRIEIGAWPELTSIGGATEVGGGEGGYYTQAEYSEIVEYAAARHVTVVPEIDMPGHTRAALASIPELNCDGVAPEPYTGVSVGISSLCIGLPITETFVRDVVGEVASLTPGAYFHVGGDEAKQTSDEDYVAFMTMVSAIVNENGKEMIAWEEVAHAGLGAGVVAQHWLEEELAITAFEAGSPILLSPATRTYLDMKYDLSSPPGIGNFWAGFIDVRMGYDWDPGAWLAGVPEERIAGIEAPLWTETIDTSEELDWMIYPRLIGYAELGWSPREGHDVEGYLVRVEGHGARLEGIGVGYWGGE